MVLRAPNTCLNFSCGLEEGAFLCVASCYIILSNCIMITSLGLCFHSLLKYYLVCAEGG